MKEHTKSYVSLLTLFVALVIFVQTNVLTLMIFSLKGETKQVVEVTKDEVVEMRRRKQRMENQNSQNWSVCEYYRRNRRRGN